MMRLTAGLVLLAAVASAEAPESLPKGAELRLGSDALRAGSAIFAPEPIGKDRLAAVTWGFSTQVVVWTLPDGKRSATFELAEGRLDVAVSPDGRRIAFRHASGIRVTDLESGLVVATVPGPEYPETLRFSPDGRHITFGDGRSAVWMAGSDSGKVEWTVDAVGRVSLMAFSPDGGSLATSDGGSSFVVVDAASGKKSDPVTLESSEIRNLAWSADGKRLAVATEGPRLRVVEAATGKTTAELDGGGEQSFTHVAWSPKGERIAAATERGDVFVFDAATGERVGSRTNGFGPCVGLTFCAEGRFVAVSDGCRVSLVDARSGAPVPGAPGHDGGVSGVAFSADGASLLSSGEYGGPQIWNLGDGSGRVVREGQGGRQRGELVLQGRAVALRKRGESWKDILEIVELASGRTTVEVPLEDMLCALRASPDGNRIAVGTRNEGIVIEALSGKILSRCETRDEDAGNSGLLVDAAWSGDGTTLGWIGREGARLVDASTGESKSFVPCRSEHEDFEETNPRALALSRDGRTCLISLDGVVKGTELLTGGGQVEWKPLESAGEARTLLAPEILDMALSPNQAILALAVSGRPALLLDTGDGRVLARMAGHQGGTSSVAFSPDGRLVATGGLDGTILVWSLERLGVAPPPIAADRDLKPEVERLTGNDLRESWKAAALLASAGPRALPFLAAAANPGPIPAPTARLRTLVARLDDADAEVRGAALQTLLDIGASAEGALREALNHPASAEQKASVDLLLERLSILKPASPRALGRLRAIATIERIGGREALLVLEALSKAEVPARERAEAMASQRRVAEALNRR